MEIKIKNKIKVGDQTEIIEEITGFPEGHRDNLGDILPSDLDTKSIGLESATTARGADRLPREVRDTYAVLNLMELATQVVEIGSDPDRTILLRWDALPQLGLLLLSQFLIGAMDGEV